jgi:hypothetical protein
MSDCFLFKCESLRIPWVFVRKANITVIFRRISKFRANAEGLAVYLLAQHTRDRCPRQLSQCRRPPSCAPLEYYVVTKDVCPNCDFESTRLPVVLDQ